MGGNSHSENSPAMSRPLCAPLTTNRHVRTYTLEALCTPKKHCAFFRSLLCFGTSFGGEVSYGEYRFRFRV